MMRIFFILTAAILLTSLLCAHAQTDRKWIEKTQLPKLSDKPDDFVPGGWEVENYAEGDLNGDNIADLAIQMIEEGNPDFEEADGVDFVKNRDRSLVVLFKRPDGSYYPAAIANRLLQCTICNGSYHKSPEAPAHIAISDGTLIVNQSNGSRNVTEVTLNFRYDKAVDRFALIKASVVVNDIVQGVSLDESVNYQLGTKITKRSRYDEKLGKQITFAEATDRVSARKTFMEEISYESFYTRNRP